jgi:hypothetical protein
MSRICCKPWEVAIIGLCSSGRPTLEDILRGPSGIPSLLLTLDILLEVDIHSSPEFYSTSMVDVLEALRWLSYYEWVEELATRDVVAQLVAVLV